MQKRKETGPVMGPGKTAGFAPASLAGTEKRQNNNNTTTKQKFRSR